LVDFRRDFLDGSRGRGGAEGGVDFNYKST